ncbi:hypothetical protein Tco_1346964 [Tanacetum coccineum]
MRHYYKICILKTIYEASKDLVQTKDEDICVHKLFPNGSCVATYETEEPDKENDQDSSWITIPPEYSVIPDETGLSQLIDFIYDDATLKTPTARALQQKVIVCPKNQTADQRSRKMSATTIASLKIEQENCILEAKVYLKWISKSVPDMKELALCCMLIDKEPAGIKGSLPRRKLKNDLSSLNRILPLPFKSFIFHTSKVNSVRPNLNTGRTNISYGNKDQLEEFEEVSNVDLLPFEEVARLHLIKLTMQVLQRKRNSAGNTSQTPCGIASEEKGMRICGIIKIVSQGCGDNFEKEIVNVNDDDEEITNEVYELKRREKGKLVEETRNSPIPTPIRSPRIHTNLRKKAKKETERLIAKAILQERGNIQAQIKTYIDNAIANVIPSEVDASIRNWDDPHDDAHPEGENNAKRQKTSKYEAYVSGESSY